MPQIKSRTFIYEIEQTCENIVEKIEYLKTLSVKYHIIGFDSSQKYLKGFICFNNPRTLNPVIKLVRLKNVKYAEEDSFIIHKNISEMKSFWEIGSIPKQSHNRRKNKDKNTEKEDSNKIYNFLIKQNQQFCSAADIIKISEENNKLKEEIEKLKQNFIIKENNMLKDRESLFKIINQLTIITSSYD